MLEALNTVLSHFVSDDKDSRDKQQGHLRGLIPEFAELGSVLLSQPTRWFFVHEPGPGEKVGPGKRPLVIRAGLQKALSPTCNEYRTGDPSIAEVLSPQLVHV